MIPHEAKRLAGFHLGAIFRSRLGRPITEADKVWLTCLMMDTNQSYFNYVYGKELDSLAACD